MHYTEQISWILFLKFMADFEEERKIDAEMDFKEYTYTIAEEYRWQVWACPKND